VLPLTAEVAFLYGEIRAELEKKGTPIGAMDLTIAAHAKATGATLVSNI
jgi:tRNA(fMet)-specific endonuclease VapC